MYMTVGIEMSGGDVTFAKISEYKLHRAGDGTRNLFISYNMYAIIVNDLCHSQGRSE